MFSHSFAGHILLLLSYIRVHLGNINKFPNRLGVYVFA